MNMSTQKRKLIIDYGYMKIKKYKVKKNKYTNKKGTKFINIAIQFKIMQLN